MFRSHPRFSKVLIVIDTLGFRAREHPVTEKLLELGRPRICAKTF